MAIAEKKLINGVDVGAIESTVNAIQEKPNLAKFKFRLSNKWINGGHNHSTASNFYGADQENSHLKTFEWDADEPPILAGKDRGGKS